MYLDKIIWLLAWPAMIAMAYYLSLVFLNKFDSQIKNDPSGEDKKP